MHTKNDELLDNFISLFRGRGDCYGGDEGACVRSPLDRTVFSNHLTDGPYVGVYPAVPRGAAQAICVWGCSDIDVESLEDARLIQRTLEMAGVVSHVERSRSKGYHVWVFASEPVPAEDMRRMLLVAHQVADYPAREVNPKQSDVSTTKVGNYVRLPYPKGMLETPSRRVVLDDNDQPVSLQDFVAHAMKTRTTPEQITRLASMFVMPTVVREYVPIDMNSDLEEALRYASPLARTILQHGPLQGHDRSNTLVKLAHICAESGLTPSMCHAVITEADKRWGKFHLRGEDGVIQIIKIIEKVYRKHT